MTVRALSPEEAARFARDYGVAGPLPPVQVCPPRTFAVDANANANWRDRFATNRDEENRKRRVTAADRRADKPAEAPRKRPPPKAAIDARRNTERDARLVRLAKAGKTVRETAAIVGMSETGVYHAARRLGVTFASPSQVNPESLALDAKIKALAAKGMTRRAIARELGIGKTTVDKRCQRLGIKTARTNGRKIDRRRDAVVVRMCRANATGAEIMPATGYTAGGLAAACERLGVDYRRVGPGRGKQRGRDASYDERVAELVAKGVYGAEIARRLGLNKTRVCKICAHLGIKAPHCREAKGPTGKALRPSRAEREARKYSKGYAEGLRVGFWAALAAVAERVVAAE